MAAERATDPAELARDVDSIAAANAEMAMLPAAVALESASVTLDSPDHVRLPVITAFERLVRPRTVTFDAWTLFMETKSVEQSMTTLARSFEFPRSSRVEGLMQ
jgi:hypothetical protein